jgi:hypothetical protein
VGYSEWRASGTSHNQVLGVNLLLGTVFLSFRNDHGVLSVFLDGISIY